jgi:predicted RNase H-like nuclease
VNAMKQVLIGFDSAWANNPKAPGAICAIVYQDGQPTAFNPPQLVNFSQAADVVRRLTHDTEYLLVAIDQPLVVPNDEGMRPCERVAGSLISKLGGGVQPARRSGSGARFFGDGAPIWSFLEQLSVRLNPFEAQSAVTGRFAIEVFPALALPSLEPSILSRGRAAKYNPAVRHNFDLADWRLVCLASATAAKKADVAQLGDWLESQALLDRPGKADQDRLDAAICLLIAIGWRFGSPEDAFVIGCGQSGYMVSPGSAPVVEILRRSADVRDIPFNQIWHGDSKAPARVTKISEPDPPVARATARPNTTIISRAQSRGAARVSADELRALLVTVARSNSLITYGEVASHFGFPWTQGFGASLKAALNQLGDENAARMEPLLMCLVVNKETRIPGPGFFNRLRENEGERGPEAARFGAERKRCQSWDW